jgi:predicted alpha-1,2-mannosidase
MNKYVLIQFGLALLCCGNGSAAKSEKTPVDYVDPFIGTGGHGHTFPGAVVPHGMVQVSPDTRNHDWDSCAGYHYSDSSIMGFSQTHFSGTGQSDLLDFLLMPGTGALHLEPGTEEDPDSGYRSRFRHETEVAFPGYYKVDLDDYKIRAELTASPRVGVLRFTFPSATDAHILLDMFHTFRERKILASDIAVVDNQLVTGYRNVKGWAKDRKIYFAARFSKPFREHALYDGNKLMENASTLSSTEIRAGFFFSTEKDEEILVKIAVSSVSAENALLNLDQEVPHWDFDQVRRNARDLWSKELSSIKADADESTLRNFYTSMYHAAIHPSLYTDVNGEYRGLDNKIHRAEGWTNYTVFSLWDTFRALHPLMTLADPDAVDDMVRSMMAHYEQSDRGMLPIWSFHHNDTDCMIGYHSVPVIADAYFKGLTRSDPNRMLAAMVSSATVRDFRGMGLYMDKGYVPQDRERDATSKTLEYAYDDWCIAKMAEALGDKPQADAFFKRSQNYRNVFDPETGFMRAKSHDGTWREPFDPFAYHHKGRKGKRTRDFTEGNAWQWNWFVPHDVQGLIGLHGGSAPFVAKLDEFFNPPSLATHKPARDATGLVGVYAQGNEPGHHAPYLFNYAGQPWKTQEILHRIMSEHFHDTPEGIPGNEDCGQMSAWYIFSAMGFYPVNPCGGIYAIGRPALSKGQLELADGKRFTVTAANLSDENIYVQSLTLNGRNLDRAWLTHDEIVQGGTLAFVMGPEPNRKWAAENPDIPVFSETRL